MKTLLSRLSLLVLSCTLALQGCVAATKKTLVSPQITAMFKGTYRVDPYFKDHVPHTVAILPFVDKSGNKTALETVRRGFYNHFSSLPYTDMELFRVDRLLRKGGLTDPEEISKASPQRLGQILKVDAVIYGTVSNFDKFYALLYSQVAVGAEIKMFETKTGHFLWSGRHVTRKHEGGASFSPIGIIGTIISTAMNVRDVQLLRACDDLFRDMVKTIPVPTIAEATRPPVITFVAQDTNGIPQKAGNIIRVVLKGDPEKHASFDIGEFRKGIEMEEVEPGGYLGTYRVIPGDNVKNAIVVGYLTDDSGNTAKWIDALGSITIDTTPPETPKNLTAVGRDGVVILSWKKGEDDDLAGYRIYRSETPLGGFKKIAQTEFNSWKDEKLVNFKRYFYAVSAIDRAGNESRRTQALLGTPVAPGPTAVSGEIVEDTIWYAGASPYIIEDEVVVRDKTLLRIEPGTVILSKGAGLRIEGRLRASGNQTHLITFGPAGKGTWAGIKFVNVREKENVLKFCQIKAARIGISCLSSSPHIQDCELTQNIDGIRIANHFSNPRILNNDIHKNDRLGLEIIDGAKPTIGKNTIRNNRKGGILIRNAAPVVAYNTITQNRGPGVVVTKSQAELKENNIYDNEPFEVVGPTSGEPVRARDNWWGSSDGVNILGRIKGRIDISTILDAPYPKGKSMPLPILAGPLKGTINSTSFLTLSNSPYVIEKDVIIDGGATLQIEPGVQLRFNKNTSIIVKDGGVNARGKEEAPIVFSSNSPSPAPGDYMNAVRFIAPTNISSCFKYCIIEYATTAIKILYGTPDITHCYIANNAQSGISCGNDAAPKILYNTIARNMGIGGIECRGMSRPKINHNNFIENPVALQCFSTIFVDASHNWWGKTPPDSSVVWGDYVKYKPWLEEPETKAFGKW